MALQTTQPIMKPEFPNKEESFSSLDSTINDMTPEESKFYSTFIDHWEMFYVNVSSFEIVQSAHLLGAKFVVSLCIMQVYHVRVVTDHISYVIKKRYRDFLQIYDKVSAFFTPITQFPKKTHIRSKVCPLLTEERKRIFDGTSENILDLMVELISMRTSNKSAVAEFLDFIDLRDHYLQKELNENIFFADRVPDNIKKNALLFGEFLRHELVKITIVPNETLRSFERIEKILSHVNKSSVKMEDLRAFLAGSNKSPGLIETGLSTDNEIVGVSFLKLSKKILNFEFCPYAEAFKKVLENISARIFLLEHEELLNHEEFKNSYFELISFYLKIRAEADNEVSLENLIMQVMRSDVIVKFQEWNELKQNIEVKIRRKTRMDLNFEKIDFRESRKSPSSDKQIPHSSIFHQTIRLFLKSGSPALESNAFEEVERKDDSFYSVSADKKWVHYSLVSEKSFEEVGEILKNWRHNKLVSSYYKSDELTKICKIFFTFTNKSNTREKLFQFEEAIQETVTSSEKILTIQLTPNSQLKEACSFYFYAKLTENQENLTQIEILYYFHENKIRNLFEKESAKMWSCLYLTIIPQEIDDSVASTLSSTSLTLYPVTPFCSFKKTTQSL